MNEDIKFMKCALKEADKAYRIQEVPIGAIIVQDGKIISKAYNEKELKQDVTKHAEIIAIQKASKKINNWRLNDCIMYVTLKPCDMCMSAIIQSRIKKLVIGTTYEFKGAMESHIKDNLKYNEYLEITENVMEIECKDILKKFFKEIRNNK